jgi:phage baseplate assembly protein gpV/phage protein D
MRPAAPAPAIALAIDGEPVAEAARAALASLRVARRLSLPAQCEVSFAFARGGNAALDDLARRARIGSRLTVAVDGDHSPLFGGDVTAHEWHHEADGDAELRLRAYDELHRLRKRQQLVARSAVTMADLVSELAAEAGLVGEVGGDAATWPVLVQHAHDDLGLLTLLGDRAGVYALVDDSTLRLVDLGGFGEPVTLQLHDTLLSVSVEASADPACRSVSASGWDPVSAEALTGRADRPRSARPANGTTAPSAVGASGERHLAGHHGPTAEHLTLASQAELDRRVAAEVVMRGTAAGDARLVPGRRVEIRGVNESIEGAYVLTETVHTLDGAGYLVELDTRPPAPRASMGGCDVTVGEVLSADDPHSLGRVRVALPAFGGVETDWREVVSAGAGKGKGLVVVPDAGDRVLVLMPGGDPASSVVLGGLYGGGGPADSGVVAGSVQRWSLASKGGQRLILDDEGHQLVVADGHGSSLTLAPERVTLHAATDLVIEAPGRSITFRADRLDMQRATSYDGPPDLPPPHVDGGGD